MTIIENLIVYAVSLTCDCIIVVLDLKRRFDEICTVYNAITDRRLPKLGPAIAQRILIDKFVYFREICYRKSDNFRKIVSHIFTVCRSKLHQLTCDGTGAKAGGGAYQNNSGKRPRI